MTNRVFEANLNKDKKKKKLSDADKLKQSDMMQNAMNNLIPGGIKQEDTGDLNTDNSEISDLMNGYMDGDNGGMIDVTGPSDEPAYQPESNQPETQEEQDDESTLNIDEYVQAIQMLNQENDKLEKDNKSLQEQNESLQLNLTDKQTTVDSYKNELEEIKKSNKKLSSQNDKLNEQLKSMSNNSTDIDQQIQDLQEQLDTKESELEDANNQINDLKDDLKEQSEENGNNQNEVDNLKQKYKDLKDQYDKEHNSALLKDQNQADELNNYKQQIIDLKDKINDLKSKNEKPLEEPYILDHVLYFNNETIDEEEANTIAKKRGKKSDHDKAMMVALQEAKDKQKEGSNIEEDITSEMGTFLVSNMKDTYKSQIFSQEFTQNLIQSYLDDDLTGKEQLFKTLIQEFIDAGASVDPLGKDLSSKIAVYVKNSI